VDGIQLTLQKEYSVRRYAGTHPCTYSLKSPRSCERSSLSRNELHASLYLMRCEPSASMLSRTSWAEVLAGLASHDCCSSGASSSSRSVSPTIWETWTLFVSVRSSDGARWISSRSTVSRFLGFSGRKLHRTISSCSLRCWLKRRTTLRAWPM
jgi:hypothetical protein